MASASKPLIATAIAQLGLISSGSRLAQSPSRPNPAYKQR